MTPTITRLSRPITPICLQNFQEHKEEYNIELENLVKQFACAHDFRFAIETFKDRYSIQTGDVSVLADQALKLYFDYQVKRRTTVKKIIEELARASHKYNDPSTSSTVENQWVLLHLLMPNIEGLKGLQDTQIAAISLKEAMIRFYDAETKNDALVAWMEDENIWSRRVFVENKNDNQLSKAFTGMVNGFTVIGSRKETTTFIPTGSSMTFKPSYSSSKSTTTATPKSPNEPKAVTMVPSRREGWTKYTPILLEGDSKVLNELSAITNLALEQQILATDELPAQTLEYMKHIVYLMPEYKYKKVSKQFLFCSWVMITDADDTGIKELVKILKKYWTNKIVYGVMVRRFCLKTQVFWTLVSNQKSHPLLPVPKTCIPGEKDYKEFLEGLGEIDPDAMAAGAALISAFNRTVILNSPNTS